MTARKGSRRPAVPLSPGQVIPAPLGQAVDSLRYWFVIGEHAVRCLCPYRPSRDVDFGVARAEDLEDLVRQLEATGDVIIQERSADTVHLRWNGLNVSLFWLEQLASFTEDRRLSVEGILATKLHAILDRGMRRDFFDLYVTLQTQQLGLLAALQALRNVHQAAVKDELLLRALTYFADAEREAPLPNEGGEDWDTVKDYFLSRVGELLVPPPRPLRIQDQRIDVATPLAG